MTPPPANPLAAVTHPDPYAWYARLVERTPVYHDVGLGLWVVASAAAVMQVLTDGAFLVRPPDDTVPHPLRGTPLGEFFARRVRMNDGPLHDHLKPALDSALRATGLTIIAVRSKQWAAWLAGDCRLSRGAGNLDAFVRKLPVFVLGSSLGIAEENLSAAAVCVDRLASALAPGAPADRIAGGVDALERLRAFVPREPSAAPGSIGRLTGEVAPATAGYESVNRVGLLLQSYEATAGALGNAILMLARHASLRTTLAADPVLIPEFLCEVLRFDPPIQNTRRFAARDVRIASQWMPAGVAVLVVLAAANRDPCANPEPEQFLIRRKFRRLFTFGAGAHACPGQELTLAIAGPGLEFVLSEGLLPEALAPVRYRPSVNARVPLLAQEG